MYVGILPRLFVLTSILDYVCGFSIYIHILITVLIFFLISSPSPSFFLFVFMFALHNIAKKNNKFIIYLVVDSRVTTLAGIGELDAKHYLI